MRVRTLIASTDCAYTSHISEYISEYHADTLDISVCNSVSQLHESLASKKFNIALIDDIAVEAADISGVDLPFKLYADGMEDAVTNSNTGGSSSDVPIPGKRIRKHRRISSIVSEILEEYACVAGDGINDTSGCITAVWSPCGGCGSTTVALAYAASKVIGGSDAFYLNLEFFASTPVYFDEQGKSISAVFEMIEDNSGNAGMLARGIHGCENGIKYMCAPDSYDDINILTAENVNELISACAGMSRDLVIDLSCVCDARTVQVFERADKILLVTDGSETAGMKLAQFTAQSNVFEAIREKTVFIVNKCAADCLPASSNLQPAGGNMQPAGSNMQPAGSNMQTASGLKPAGGNMQTASGLKPASGNMQTASGLKPALYLPYIQSTDARFIYKSLAQCNFDM